jgi:hypothetical protein
VRFAVLLSVLNDAISKTINTIHGISDRSEKIIPIIPTEEGMIMKKPETSPHMPMALLNFGLLYIA